MMHKNKRWMSAAVLAGGLMACATAGAQTAPGVAEPRNVMQLSAAGTVEVAQDLLQLTLASSREGADAATVQSQLRQALDAALAEAKRQAAPGQMDVRTGAFGLYPRYAKDGKINGWQGRAELVLEGKDFPRITGAAARITSMNIRNVGFGLSREARAKVESDAQAQAIEQFKQRAAELSRSFGFAGYTLREVSVTSSDMQPPQVRMMVQSAKLESLSSDAPVPVEAGKAQVTVNISGSVQMK